MMARILLLSFALTALAACGVKTDLDPPAGAQTKNAPQSTDQRTPDPSKPPHPLGQ
jgi:predicted small lipoprotein YifL